MIYSTNICQSTSFDYITYHNIFNEIPSITTSITFKLYVKYNNFDQNPSLYCEELDNMLRNITKYFFEYTNNNIHNETYWFSNEEKKLYEIDSKNLTFIDTENNIMFIISRADCYLSIKIFTNKKNENYYKVIEKIEQLHTILPLEPKSPKCYMITHNGNSFNLINFPINETKFNLDNYNDDFKPVVDHIETTLINSNKGIVLLHGEMGTGKTSYLRSLMNIKLNKKIIYVPPEMAEKLASPEFIPFLEDSCKNSIILIEDAENVLHTRESGRNQSVANILNVSDGILGDILNIQFVCTFNSTLQLIDPALRRPGRLIAEYEFKKLTVEKTASLIKKLYNIEYIEGKELTLAEIYNYNSIIYATKEKEKVFGLVP